MIDWFFLPFISIHSGVSRTWSRDSRNHQYSDTSEGPGQRDSSGWGKKQSHKKFVHVLAYCEWRDKWKMYFSFPFFLFSWLNIIDSFCQDIFQQNIGRTGPQFSGSPLSKAPLTTSQNSGRPPGKKKGPKPKEVLLAAGPPSTKRKSQKGLLKTEAGELDLIEIHTKHTLKKFQPGKSKGKNKVRSLQAFMVTLEIILFFFCVWMFHP